MFSHVMIGTNDLEKAKAFYDALLGTLGVRPARVDGHRIFYFTKTGVFSMAAPPAKIRRAYAKAPRAKCTWLICAISTATRSARCIGSCRRRKVRRVG